MERIPRPSLFMLPWAEQILPRDGRDGMIVAAGIVGGQ
jgi:hypothetical protein